MKIDIYRYIIFIVFFLCLLLLMIGTSQPREVRNEVKEGEIFCFTKDREYWGQLTDYCVQDDYLYVLFGSKGVLKIYDIDGTYIKSYAFLKTKGESELHTDGGLVYLFDQSLNSYSFSSGELVDIVPYSNYRTYLQKKATFVSKEEQRKTDDAQYSMRFASIYRTNADNSSAPVVCRPFFLMYYQSVIPFVLMFLCIAVIWILKIRSK